MELKPVHRMLGVLYCHDFAVVGLGSNPEARRDCTRVNGQ
jgi:hypothetical protein